MSTEGRVQDADAGRPRTSGGADSHPVGQAQSKARERIAGEILLKDERRFMDLVRLGEDKNDDALDRAHSELYGSLRTLQIHLGLA